MKITDTTAFDEILKFNDVKLRMYQIFFTLKLFQLNQLEPINVMTRELKYFTHFQFTVEDLSNKIDQKTHRLHNLDGKYEFSPILCCSPVAKYKNIFFRYFYF